MNKVAWATSGVVIIITSLTACGGGGGGNDVSENPQPPSLTLVKTVINDDFGTSIPSDWTLTANGFNPASPAPGTYALSESGPGGYVQTSLTCSNTGVIPVISVTLDMGEAVRCEFVNDDIERYELDTGIATTCAVDDNGLQCWGQEPVSSVSSGDNITDVRTASNLSNCRIADDGLACWGDPSSTTLSPPALQSPIAVDVHSDVACAVDITGVVCWGNRAGELGAAPQLNGPREIALSYGGGVWACALDALGVKCWGDNASGQLNIPQLVNPRQITAGESHACALDDTGVVCWGENANGQAEVPQLANPIKVSAGLFYTCALHDSGVTCWGGVGLPICNTGNCGPGYDYGQTQVPPLVNPFNVSVGYTHVCALDQTGAICWGRNLVGEADNRPLLFSN